MSTCREVEPLFAPYADGEAGPAERAAVEAHLRGCETCRVRVAGERTAREAVRRCAVRLRAAAPASLHERCARLHGTAPSRAAWRRTWIPLSVAAALVLGVGVFLWGGGGMEAYAAQLAVDHKTCFQFSPGSDRHDAVQVAERISARSGWRVQVPASAPDHHLQLLDGRRCLSAEGRVAHILYRWRGEPFSLYVLNEPLRAVPEGGVAVATVDRLGERAIMWRRGGRTYAVVTGSRDADVNQVVKYVRETLE
jgi:anti-sigma factor RsiW